jgi:hypothetical protein
MPFRFRKIFKIAPGIRINLSKTGISTSIGKPGASLNIGKKGTRITAGIPGTGLSVSEMLSSKKTKAASQAVETKPRHYQAAQISPVPKKESGKKIPLSVVIFSGIAAMSFSVALCVAAVNDTFFSSPTALPTVDFVSAQNTALAEAWLSYTQTVQASITDTPLPTATWLPTETSLPTETASPLPTATFIVFSTSTPFIVIAQPTSAPISGGCSCASDSMNCGDFSSWSAAQACYTSCLAAGAGDIHRLDGNNDGSACDSLK